MEAPHTMLINRLCALRHSGVDRGTAIILRYPSQPQGRFLKSTTPRSGSPAHNPSVSKRKTYKTKQLALQSISWNAGPDDEPLAPDPVPRSVKGLTALRLRNDGRYLRSSRRRPAPMATEATPERDSCAILTRMFSTCVVTVRMEIPSSEAIC